MYTPGGPSQWRVWPRRRIAGTLADTPGKFLAFWVGFLVAMAMVVKQGWGGSSGVSLGLSGNRLETLVVEGLRSAESEWGAHLTC